MKWAYFLHPDTNLGKLNVDLILLGGYAKKWVRPFRWYGTLKSGALKNDVMNQADWLNDFWSGLNTSPLCIFDIFWVSTAVVLVENDVLFVVSTRKVLELDFPEYFLIKAWLNVERLSPVEKNMWNDQKRRCSSCMAIEPHNFKILAFLLYGYHSPHIKNIAIPAIAFSPHNLPTR